jgi:hypothetical protein
MDWIAQNWQTVAAVTIVACTVLTFSLRLVRPQQKRGCGDHCQCEAKRLTKVARD